MADHDTSYVAAALLRKARRHREWTQAEFARRAEIPASQLCAYETSAKQPSAATLAKLLGVAGLNLVAATEEMERLEQGRRFRDVLSFVDGLPFSDTADQPAFGPFAELVNLP
ncbi:MAG: helix-turn-helix domain-containing protein [Sporichthyaceae bacterium]